MYIKCNVCEQEFDVDISHAGKSFRCPKCGSRFRFPDTALLAHSGYRVATVSRGAAPTSPERYGLPAATYPEQSSMAWLAILTITAVTTITGLYFLIRTINDDADFRSAATSGHVSESGNTVPGQLASSQIRQTGPSLAAAPALATDFYRGKAPIEMTQSEWSMTLSDWGQLPTWWSQWTYNEEHPWTYPLNCQAELSRTVTQLEQTERVTETKVQQLRRELSNARRQYPAQPENSPHDLIDRYLRNARCCISRELMQQQLDEAASHLSAMLRPNSGGYSQDKR